MDASPPGLDLDRLTVHLRDHRPDLATGPLSAEVVAGGRSNLTYVVTDGATRFVLRRPPLGHVLATAHDMGREVRVLSALAPTPVPVPAVLLACEDAGVLGAPFYLMEHVDGAVYRTARDLATVSPEDRLRLAHRLVDVLADLHTLDPPAVHLADFGRPDGYLARQVRRWGRQLEGSRSRDLVGVDELRAELADAVPAASGVAVLHGDYRLDNVLVDRADPGRVAAVLDWEMATLGDPLADLGLLVVYRAGLPRNAAALADAMAAPGFPPVAALVARYAERRGADVTHLSWYAALAFFKLAVILEGIHYRYVQGRTVGAGFEHIGALVEPLVEAGLVCLRENRLPTEG